MDIERRFEPEHNLVRYDVRGVADPEALLAFAAETVKHPEFVRGMNTIWNLREAELSHLSSVDFRRSRSLPRAPLAVRGQARVVIVTGNDLTYGLVRMFLGYAGLEHFDYHVVHTIPDAYRLLDIPD